ncbi:MAG: hypothetical protein NVS1B4_19020 [Gemmatimonadaceae bacterium]
MLIDPRPHREASSIRRGVTLVEMLVAMVILGIVAGTVMMTVVRQQQFYASMGNLISVRDNVRDAANFVSSELRALSPGAGDIYAMTDSSIDYRAARGAAVVCAIDPTGRASVTVPPARLASGSALSSWATAPQKGDSLLVFADTSTGSGAGVWQAYAVTQDASFGASCPTSTGFTASAAEAASGVMLYVTPALPNTVGVGAPIRIFRRAHYSLYSSPAGSWYLGFYDCLSLSSRPTPCNAIAPVAGPFLPYVATGGSGVQFTYFDKSGAATATPTAVARIRLAVRGQARTTGSAFGSSASGFKPDSIGLLIAVRNPP